MDAAGNVSQIGSNPYDHNNAGRLYQIRTPANPLLPFLGYNTVATYTYNALGQRVLKDGTVFEYEQGGKLIGEVASAGAVPREYIYLGGELLAVSDPGSPATCKSWLGSICLVPGNPAVPAGVYFAHNDHLGTTQALTDGSAAIAWAADFQPFGAASVSNQKIANNLRLPGQYLDGESGLYYNRFREYEPTTGRYIESDALGLSAGINTYAYVRGNPIGYSDPLGLQVFGGGLVSIPGSGAGFSTPSPNFPGNSFNPCDFDGNYYVNQNIMNGAGAGGALGFGAGVITVDILLAPETEGLSLLEILAGEPVISRLVVGGGNGLAYGTTIGGGIGAAAGYNGCSCKRQ